MPRVRYRYLGSTGVRVSELCLGAMMFGAWGNPDRADCARIIHRALDGLFPQRNCLLHIADIPLLRSPVNVVIISLHGGETALDARAGKEDARLAIRAEVRLEEAFVNLRLGILVTRKAEAQPKYLWILLHWVFFPQFASAIERKKPAICTE